MGGKNSSTGIIFVIFFSVVMKKSEIIILIGKWHCLRISQVFALERNLYLNSSQGPDITNRVKPGLRLKSGSLAINMLPKSMVLADEYVTKRMLN